MWIERPKASAAKGFLQQGCGIATHTASMRMWALYAAIVLSMTAMRSTSADEAALLVSPEVMQFYNGEYQRLKSPRAIAVADDGFHFGYSYCPEYRCYMNPTARNLALQACLESGGRGCRVFAIDDDIKVSYRVGTLVPASVPAPPIAPSVQPTSDCGAKAEGECAAIIADFNDRRRTIEAKWISKLAEVERRWCYNINHRPVHCAQKRSEAVAERDAELKALEEEMRAALGS